MQRNISLLDYWFLKRGHNSRTARWKRPIGQGLREGQGQGVFKEHGALPVSQLLSSPIQELCKPSSWVFTYNRICVLERSLNFLVVQWLKSTWQCRGHGFKLSSGKSPHALGQLSPCITTSESACCRTHALQQEMPP